MSHNEEDFDDTPDGLYEGPLGPKLPDAAHHAGRLGAALGPDGACIRGAALAESGGGAREPHAHRRISGVEGGAVAQPCSAVDNIGQGQVDVEVLQAVAGEIASGIQDDAPNGTAGGGGAESCNVHADGGGGGHATEGSQGGDYASYHCGGPGGQGGGTIGDELLTSGVFVGGGGGGGYYDTDAGVGGYGGEGGAGGGLVRIVALDGFAGAGSITARGADGEDGYWPDRYTSPGGGGGGAGGTILLVGDGSVSLDASGGVGGEGSEAGQHLTAGGTGGDGRIRVDGAWSGTSSPEAVSGCD